MKTCVRVRARGPLCIEGPVEIYDASGKKLDTSERAKVLLCRCGASKTAPLCDGSHNRIGFHPSGEE